MKHINTLHVYNYAQRARLVLNTAKKPSVISKPFPSICFNPRFKQSQCKAFPLLCVSLSYPHANTRASITFIQSRMQLWNVTLLLQLKACLGHMTASATWPHYCNSTLGAFIIKFHPNATRAHLICLPFHQSVLDRVSPERLGLSIKEVL